MRSVERQLAVAGTRGRNQFTHAGVAAQVGQGEMIEMRLGGFGHGEYSYGPAEG